MLEVGGVLEAFDASGVTPPSTFESWVSFIHLISISHLFSDCKVPDIVLFFQFSWPFKHGVVDVMSFYRDVQMLTSPTSLLKNPMVLSPNQQLPVGFDK